VDNIKLQFKLRDRVDGSLLDQIMNVNDDTNGLIQYPIDLKQWEIIEVKPIIQEYHFVFHSRDGMDVYTLPVCNAEVLEALKHIVTFSDSDNSLAFVSQGELLYLTPYLHGDVQELINKIRDLIKCDIIDDSEELQNYINVLQNSITI